MGPRVLSLPRVGAVQGPMLSQANLTVRLPDRAQVRESALGVGALGQVIPHANLHILAVVLDILNP